MKTSPLAAIAASLSVAFASAPSAAQDAPPQGQPVQKEGGSGGSQPRGGQGGGREGSRGGPRGNGPGAGAANVEGAMKGMNRGLKAIKAAMGDAARKPEALRLVSEMQRDCATAKSMPLPAAYTKGAADEAAKQKLEAEYAADMRKLMRMLVDLEDAIAADKADEVKALLARIEEQREHSHKELGVD